MSSRPSTTQVNRGTERAVRVYIALGSNLPSEFGSPSENVRLAMDRISAWSVETPRRSSLWSSEPEDCPPGSDIFINAVIAITLRHDSTPESLLTKTKALEKEFGRVEAGERNAPRPIDIDLVAFGDETRHGPDLMLPHPRAHKRGFVLYPLAEIDPDYRIPGQALSVAELAQKTQLPEKQEI